MQPKYKLVAFDGDETLWTLPSGLNLSDRFDNDPVGRSDFTFTLISATGEASLVRRDDGALFALRPETFSVLRTLRSWGVLIGVISFNHEHNIESILQAFGLRPLVDYVVAEWHSNKDDMMLRMIGMAHNAGHTIEPKDTMLVDDDYYGLYFDQYRRLGARLVRFGKDITDFTPLLAMVRPTA
jgi:predicted phosphatase